MSGKHLTELEWKKFTRGKKLEDKDFVKGLAALEIGARAKDLAAQQKALDEIDKQAAKLRAAHKADKELLRYLDDADKDLAAERRQLSAQLKHAAKTQAAEAQPDEDDEGPAVLSTKLLPLLRQVPKSEAPLPAMVAVLGKQAVVLVSRRAIGTSRRKMLAESLGSTSGVKYMPGECVWEAKALTFVLEARVANLAKLIKAALLQQTDVRFKVRVRGSDPDDVDEDLDDDEGAHEQEDSEQEGQEQPSADRERYLSQLATLEVRVGVAVRDQAADAAKMQSLLAFAKGKAAEDKHAAALQSLALVAKLLGTPAPTTAPDIGAQLTAALSRLTPQIQQAITTHPERRAQLAAALADFQARLKAGEFVPAGQALKQLQALIAGEPTAPPPRKPARVPARPVAPIWESASERVLAQASALIIELRRLDDPEAARLADDLLDTLNDYLSAVGDTLDEYDAAASDQRAELAADARDFLREQQADIADDSLIAAADSNPFELKLDIRRTMDKALNEIVAAFEA